MSARLGRAAMVRHATDWIAAWNRRDLDAVLDAFHDHATFRSPRATPITGAALVRGKPAMELYWRAGLARLHRLDFTLLGTVCDVAAQAMLVHYLARFNDTTLRACEVLRFKDGRTIYAEALYGDAEADAAAHGTGTAHDDGRPGLQA